MKRHVFESIVEGEVFGPLDLNIDAHLVRGYAFAVEDYSTRYFRTAQDCGPLAPPALLAKRLLHIFMTKYDPQGVSAVHLKNDIEFHAPPRFGDDVELSARYADVFVRKGRTCVVLDGEARDSSGRVLVRNRSIEIVPSESAHAERPQAEATGLSQRRVNAVLPDNPTTAENAVSGRAGMVLPKRQRTIQQDQMSVFVGANENWRNIHTDIEVARAAGFKRTIMSGMIQACWFTHMMTDHFGDAFLTGGRLGITFLSNVASGETVDLHAVIREALPDGTQEIEFWSTNAAGEQTAVGWATGQFEENGGSAN